MKSSGEWRARNGLENEKEKRKKVTLVSQINTSYASYASYVYAKKL